MSQSFKPKQTRKEGTGESGRKGAARERRDLRKMRREGPMIFQSKNLNHPQRCSCILEWVLREFKTRAEGKNYSGSGEKGGRGGCWRVGFLNLLQSEEKLSSFQS